MSSVIRQKVSTLVHIYPYSACAVSIICLLFTTLFIISEIFKPVGRRRLASWAKPKLPPGPGGIPIFGKLLDLKAARDDQHHIFLKEFAKYGEMTTVHLGSKTWVFLNTNRVMSEIIAKRGTLTNGLSPMPIASGIVMHSLLSGTALKQYGEWQELESTQLMAEYLYQPERWHAHHYRYANSVAHRIALGERLVKSTQELADLQNVVTYFVGSIGSSVIDWFPQLNKLPKVLQLWRKHWEKLGEWNYDVYRSWWLPIKKKIDEGTAPPSFVRDVLLNLEMKFTGNDEEAMYVAMQLIEAGSDTTREALNIFVMAMLCYPAVHKKAKEEVDRVCGSEKPERLPGVAEMDQMPFICAIVKEVLRWRPIFILTPDHTLTADFEFEGYRFPAGVGFVINEVPVCNEVEDTDEFKPERWLDGGRRICVGYRLARRGLFINIARLVYCYNYTALNHHMTNEPFPVEVTIRSKEHDELVIEEAKNAGVLDAVKKDSQDRKI